MAPMGISSDTQLARMAAGLRLEDVPPDVREAAVDCIIDTLAVALAGSGDSVPRRVAEIAAAQGDAVVIGDAGRVSPADSALINATAAHVLDYDDWLPAARIHPSAPLFPATLAAAQAGAAPVTGPRLVAAYVAGFETQARIGAAMGVAHYDAGFHPTATVGIFGAAAASAHVGGASPSEMEGALGLAGTSAAGIRAAFGTPAKSIQVGNASRNGVLAARLAAGGLLSSAIPVLGKGGFAASHGHRVDDDVATASFDSQWYLREVALKEHASCFGTHAPINAILGFRDRLPIDRITTIDITVSEVMRTVCAIPWPTTALEGKFSLCFTAALAVVEGHCRVDDFTLDAVHSPDLRDVGRKVRLYFDTDLPPQKCRVRIALDSGETLAAEHDSANPVSASLRRKVSRDKFAALAAPIVGVGQADEILAVVEGLIDDRSVADLVSVLGADRS